MNQRGGVKSTGRWRDGWNYKDRKEVPYMKRTDKDNAVGTERRVTHSNSEWSEWEEELNGSEECQTYS